MLKLKSTPYFDLEDSDFEQLVQSTYNQDYCFSADIEANYNCFYKYSVKPKLDKFEKEDIEKFTETGEYSQLAGVLLNDLCKKGHIPKGEYLLTVCH